MNRGRPVAIAERRLAPHRFRLTLRELEALAGTRLTGFLALLHAAVTRHAAGLLESGAEIGVSLDERTGQTVADCASLTGNAAALREHDNVGCRKVVAGNCDRLLEIVAKSLGGDVSLEGFTVDGPFTLAFNERDARDGGFAAAGAGGNDLLGCHSFSVPLELDCFGLLRSVSVLCACEHFETRHHLARNVVLREHAPHSFLDHAIRMRCAHLSGRKTLQAIAVSGIALIFLLLFLLARELHESGVGDDNESALVDRRVEIRGILRAELVGDQDGDTAKNLILRVHQIPLPVVAGVLAASRFLQHVVFLSFVALCPEGLLSVLLNPHRPRQPMGLEVVY